MNLPLRVLLLSGASLSIIGLGVPTYAATTSRPGLSDVDTSDPVEDVLDICLVDEDCDFGTDSLGSGFIEARIDDVSDGQVEQIGISLLGDVDLAMDNSGSASVKATAGAGPSGSAATASAYISDGFEQVGVAADDVTLNLTNSGELAVGANALAKGDTTGLGIAIAIVDGGIAQRAASTGVGDAAVSLSNAGSIDIGVDAWGRGGSALADARLDGIVQTAQSPQGGGARVALTNKGEITIHASAVAGPSNEGQESANTLARAQMIGISQIAAASAFRTSAFTVTGGTQVISHVDGGLGKGQATFENEGLLDISASVSAQGVEAAAVSEDLRGLFQEAGGTSVDLNVANSGAMTIGVNALAAADTVAFVSAYEGGVTQSAHATDQVHQTAFMPDGSFSYINGQRSLGPARVNFSNEGSIDVAGVANATAGAVATSGTVPVAGARMINWGVKQFVRGADAQATLTNKGSVNVSAIAGAAAAGGAAAVAAASGLHQGAAAVGASSSDHYNSSSQWQSSNFNFYRAGPASSTLVNTGVVDVSAEAKSVSSDGPATASVSAWGWSQAAAGTLATVSADNQNLLAVAAKASASGTTGLVSAVAAGMTQLFSSATSLVIDIANSGSIDIKSDARSVQKNGATAQAAAIGLTERGIAYGKSRIAFDNEGSIEIHANAAAEGGYFAGGTAWATGVNQHTLTPVADLSFENSGSIEVASRIQAAADADTGFAGVTAFAHGYIGQAYELSAHVANAGTLDVSAKASGEGADAWAKASAVGMAVIGATATTYDVLFADIDGTLDNSGHLNVLAAARGVGGGGEEHSSSAQAIGVQMLSRQNSMIVSNTGSIVVDAISDFGGTAKAYASPARAFGIQVISRDNLSDPDADSVFTLNNKGTIVARQSTDGGATWSRGMAIDLAHTGNKSVLNLLGGEIYGDIDVQDRDVINVEDGRTVFDGTINRGCSFFGTDDPNGCGVGTLNIANGGNLYFADARFTGLASMYDGPSTAFVNALNVGADGTLTLQLHPASGGVQSAGSYQQIFANTANLAGTLAADFATQDGLFADSYSWNNVIQANAVTGSFDQCALVGQYADSPLLNFTCSYDDDGNVDLALTRVAFDAVQGLSRNGTSTAGAIEAAYAGTPNAGFTALAGDLFAIDGADNYKKALNQVSGSPYANYLQSFPSLAVRFNDVVDEATSCSDRSASVSDCRAGKVRTWGQLDYQKRDADGDTEAGADHSKRLAALIGVDASVGQSVVLGLSGGAVSNHLSNAGDTIKGDGYQAGAYGLFDAGRFFVKGIAGYSWFKGDSRRRIDFAPLGGSFASTVEGRPDATMWSLGLHGGYRIATGKQSVLSPYLNLDYAGARLKGFTEIRNSGDAGAELSVSGGRVNRLFATGGIKWAGRVGSVEPEINLGYRYRFGNSRSAFSTNAIGGESTAFDIVSSAEKRGAVLAGLSLNGRLGPVDLRVAYDGEFGSKAKSNSVNFRIALPLGSARK